MASSNFFYLPTSRWLKRKLPRYFHLLPLPRIVMNMSIRWNTNLDICFTLTARVYSSGCVFTMQSVARALQIGWDIEWNFRRHRISCETLKSDSIHRASPFRTLCMQKYTRKVTTTQSTVSHVVRPHVLTQTWGQTVKQVCTIASF